MNKTTIGEITSTITKGTTPTSIGHNFTNKGINFLRIKDLKEKKIDFSKTLFISDETDKVLSRSRIYPADVLFSIAGSIGKSVVVNRDSPKLNCNQAIAILRPIQELVDSRYLSYWLSSQTAKKQIASSLVKATIPNLSLGQIKNLKIDLPQIDEQQKIAMILDRANDKISLANLRQVKLQGLIQNIFANAFTQSSMMDSEWPILELSEIVKKGTIISYGIVQAGDEYPGGVPYVRTGDISNNEISLNGLRHTSPEIALNFKRTTIYENDILMSIRATVGTTALVPKILEGSNLSRGIALISPGDKVTSEYLLYFLRSSKTQNWIQRQVKGATFREITLKRLRELPVVIPPISIQRDFSKKVKKYNELLTTVLNYKNLLNGFYQSLEFDLINSSK